MEARIARLEAEVAHLRTDVAHIKVDLRTPTERPSPGAVVTDLLAFRVLAFVLYFVCTAAMFGGLAHGFGWI